MKKFILAAASVLMVFSVSAKDTVKVGPYKLTKVYENPTTSVKDQNRTGTCWAFSTLAVVESDIIKDGKADMSLDLSEMWIARHAYFDKFVKYVRMQGKICFEQGGAAHDIPAMIEKYGIVREKDYPGLSYGEKNHVHSELMGVLKSYANTLVKNPNGRLTPVWKDAVNGILDAYLGKCPETISVDGKDITPKEYAKSLGINTNNYVEFASATHHPFGEKFIYEVADNWAWSEVNNIPLKDFTELAIEALKNGYTIAWGSDVSDKGFRFKDGFAVYPDFEASSVAGLERAKWEKMNREDKNKALFSKKVNEKEITQEYRALLFDNYTATDDHGMQIVGLYQEADGTLFFKVKNSWTTNSSQKGYFYASESFFEALTMNFMINKNAISKASQDKYIK
ncbi:MAG: aminopeptidase [Bacteroidetes bacterium]|nr:aminopeptidase [Bacteroidota bacterium]